MSKPADRIPLALGIDKPLGFYVLALLIVEGFLGIILTVPKWSEDHIVAGMWVGVALFVYITLTVSLFLAFKPHVLTFDRDAHLRDRRALGPFGTSKRPIKDPEALPSPGNPEPEAR